MPEVLRNALVLGAALPVLALLGGGRRAAGAAAALVAALAAAWLLGLRLPAGEWAQLPVRVGLGPSAWAALPWAAAAAIASRAGAPLRLPGPLALVAPVLGALAGDCVAAAVLARGAAGPGAAARLALAAGAGALLSPWGDAGRLVLGAEAGLGPRLAAAAVLWGVAAPWRASSASAGGRLPVGAFGAALVGAAGLSLLVHPGLGGLVVAAALVLRPGPEAAPWRALRGLGGLAAAAAAVGVVAVVALGGAPLLLAESMEATQARFGVDQARLVGLAGLVAAALVGELPAALAARVVVDTSAGVFLPWDLLSIGVSLGGLGPLIVAGAVHPGALRAGLGRALVGAGLAWLAAAVALGRVV